MIFFLHLFKTGGQTLATRLASAFRLEKVHILGPGLNFGEHGEEFRRLIEEKDFVESHVSGPLLRDRTGIEILTTVRDPIERIVSSYRAMRREAGDFFGPANALAPADFFRQYRDFVTDDQVNGLVSALFEPPPNILIKDRRRWIYDDRWLYDHLQAAIDAIRWLVPTEQIGDFVPFWSLETKIAVADNTSVLNSAPADDVDVDAVREIVRQMPELYAKDLYLWQRARSWFDSWRESIISNLVPPNGNHSRCAFHRGESGVWCGTGWHAPIGSSIGTEFIAGPSTLSELKIIRGASEPALRFKIGVLTAINAEELRFYRKGSRAQLNSKLEVDTDGRYVVTVPIDSFAKVDTLQIQAPQSLSPMQISDEPNPTRRPYSIFDVSLPW